MSGHHHDKFTTILAIVAISILALVSLQRGSNGELTGYAVSTIAILASAPSVVDYLKRGVSKPNT